MEPASPTLPLGEQTPTDPAPPPAVDVSRPRMPWRWHLLFLALVIGQLFAQPDLYSDSGAGSRMLASAFLMVVVVFSVFYTFFSTALLVVLHRGVGTWHRVPSRWCVVLAHSLGLIVTVLDVVFHALRLAEDLTRP